MKTVYKPWGKEEWLELNDKYCYKRIYINAGYKTSYQYHNFKRETNYIISGTAEVWLENDHGEVEKKIMKAGEFFNVTPPKKHRVIAITDIILQEVSTPEVDDVIRLEDDTNREDGRLEHEHVPPAVLILAAGMGTRLGKLTQHVNKGLVPLNNKAVISHLIEKFPSEYEIVIATGYKSESLIDYVTLAHPDRKFKFVPIDDWESNKSGPGVSALACKEHLQRPFYWVTVDCLFEGNVLPLDSNWIGLHRTAFPEKYSTAKLDSSENIIEFKNKSSDGFENGFIGLASILDYNTFWTELENNMQDGEIVSAFDNISAYKEFKGKVLNWMDMGNLDDIERAKQIQKDKPISLYKDTGEITYKVNNKFIKFFADKVLVSKKNQRAKHLDKLIPSSYKSKGNFYTYEWQEGETVYNTPKAWDKFLNTFKNNISNCNTFLDISYIKDFYIGKTQDRLNKFKEKYGSKYFNERFLINNKEVNSLESIWGNVEGYLKDTPLYSNFHGDLQFDNIIFTPHNKFLYIDWRDSFSSQTEGGDLYYDLAKLYGGLLVNYNAIKNDSSFTILEASNTVEFNTNTSSELQQFRLRYENWLMKEGYDLNYVKFITSLIFLSMSPLHSDKFNKLIFFYGIKLLNEYDSNK